MEEGKEVLRLVQLVSSIHLIKDAQKMILLTGGIVKCKKLKEKCFQNYRRRQLISLNIPVKICCGHTLCDGLDEKDKVSGCYRELDELLLKLAEFYLSMSY
ncbi:Hypothetical predicted protein [Paramuricea clavata]|uniref:Uncharacterized protein n=1 Tax=Paramuricea clavata TaxID=317549 RepID=A0A6S7JEZ4_PARCT|nr:Hypothetical predicted protein [Paramuricea clavata]